MNIFLRHRNKLMKRNYYLKENDELILIKVQLGAIYNYDKLIKIILTKTYILTKTEIHQSICLKDLLVIESK